MSEEQNIDSNEQIAIRRQKLEKLREQGRAYPNGFERDALSSDIIEKFATVAEAVIGGRGDPRAKRVVLGEVGELGQVTADARPRPGRDARQTILK